MMAITIIMKLSDGNSRSENCMWERIASITASVGVLEVGVVWETARILKNLINLHWRRRGKREREREREEGKGMEEEILAKFLLGNRVRNLARNMTRNRFWNLHEKESTQWSAKTASISIITWSDFFEHHWMDPKNLSRTAKNTYNGLQTKSVFS